jgi:uncharacterized repeat protein (TIGR03803 family)
VFVTLHRFTGWTDGAVPVGLTQAGDGTLYGIAEQGGASGGGTAFRIVIVPNPILRSPAVSGGNFSFMLQTAFGQSYTVQQCTNLGASVWEFYTNFVGDGSLRQLVIPLTHGSSTCFRIREP